MLHRQRWQHRHEVTPLIAEGFQLYIRMLQTSVSLLRGYKRSKLFASAGMDGKVCIAMFALFQIKRVLPYFHILTCF